MSGLRSGPRFGSRTYAGLEALYRAGGSVDLHGWMRACEWTDSIRAFGTVIVDRLQVLDMVGGDSGRFSITRRGLEHLDIADDEPDVVVPCVAGPRIVVSPGPLKARNMMRLPLLREGALDYLAIPSRMGNQSVPHPAGAMPLAGGDGR